MYMDLVVDIAKVVSVAKYSSFTIVQRRITSTIEVSACGRAVVMMMFQDVEML